MREILFSELSLDLKKQFIRFLANRQINFQQFKIKKYMTTKIKIRTAKGRPTKIVLKAEDIDHLARKVRSPSKYHIDCVADRWSYSPKKEREKRNKVVKRRKKKRKKVKKNEKKKL